MFSTQRFILFFFVVSSLLAMGSARGIFFWARQNDQQNGDGGISISDPLGAGTTSDGGAVGTTTDSGTTTDGPTTSTSTTSDITTTTSTSSTSTSTTPTTTSTSIPTEETSTIPNTTPGASTEVVVVKTSVLSGSTVASTTTRPASSTATNGLASPDSSGSSGGMPQQTKNVAIGVGVGVGGAILLGALAVVAWRMWGRKKQRAEEDHFLMSDPIGSEKPSSPSTVASPFKSTLDQYHNPAGRLNTASNF